MLPKKQLSIAAVRERAHSSHQNQNKQNKKFPDRKTLVSANCDETVLVLSAKVGGLDKVGRIYQLSKPKLNLRRFSKKAWNLIKFRIFDYFFILTAEIHPTLPWSAASPPQVISRHHRHHKLLQISEWGPNIYLIFRRGGDVRDGRND